jgi:hypothetical protein
MIILKRISRRGMGKHERDGSGSVYGQVAGTCECGNELSVSKIFGLFLEYEMTC